MKAAFIVMSILGCNDAGAQCTPVAQIDQQWQTISDCDAASEKQLARYTYVNKPMVVAVCQTAETTALVDSAEDSAGFETADRVMATASQPPPDDEQKRGITARAINLVKNVIPSRQSLTDTARYPVHVVTGTYSWVARKIVD
ncbi:hypothetical protein [Rhizobium sp.]